MDQAQAQASPAWYLLGIADGDCPKWHHLQLWGICILSILPVSWSFSGLKRLLDPGLKPGRRSSGLLLLRQHVKKEGDDQPDLRRVSKRLGSLELSTLFGVQDCGMFLPCDRTLLAPLHVSTPLAS
jgi:hypothetical protein